MYNPHEPASTCSLADVSEVKERLPSRLIAKMAGCVQREIGRSR